MPKDALVIAKPEDEPMNVDAFSKERIPNFDSSLVRRNKDPNMVSLNTPHSMAISIKSEL